MKNNLSKVLLVTTSMLGVVTPAFAQETSNDIVVTARRSEEKLQDVPISITVFNQEQLSNRNVISTADIATYTPSLSTNARFGAESTSFAIRGFTQEGPTSPSVGVYFADVVAPRANGGTTAGNGAGVGSMFDLQNVQVLKGPQGTLFGRNTTGGAILLVPQKPTDTFGGYVEGSLGNYDMRRIQGVVNIPFNDKVRLRLGIDHQKREGYLNNVNDVGPKDFEDVNYTAARATLAVDITPTLDNSLILSASDSDTNGSYTKVYSNVSNNPTIAAELNKIKGDFWDVANGNPDASQHIRQWGAINTTTWQASENLTLKNIISYTEFRQQQSTGLFGDETLIPGSNPRNYLYSVSLFNKDGFDNASQSTFTEEFQIQGDAFDSRLTYQAGAYLEIAEPLDGFQTTLAPIFLACQDVQTNQCTDLIGLLTPAPPALQAFGITNLQGFVGFVSQSASQYKFNNQGIYAQGTYKLTDQWSITGGIRYTKDETKGLGQALKANFPLPNTPVYSCANPPPLTVGGTSAQILADNSRCNFARTAESDKPTWLIDVDYKPSDNILLYAKYARGYRQGNINVSSYGLETWGPEEVDSYEVGAKTSWRGAMPGTFNVAVFTNELKDQQVQANTLACEVADLFTNPVQCPFLASPAAGIANAGKSTINGVEIEASVSPLEGLRFDLGYAYLDTKLESIALPPPPPGLKAVFASAIVGGPLSITPEQKVSLTGTYTLPLSEDIGKIALSATYTYQDEMFGTAGAPVGFQTLPSQENLNLNANWNSVLGQPVDLAFFATNVTEEEYFTYVGGTTFGFDNAVLNQPRMYGVRLKYRFGG